MRNLWITGAFLALIAIWYGAVKVWEQGRVEPEPLPESGLSEPAPAAPETSVPAASAETAAALTPEVLEERGPVGPPPIVATGLEDPPFETVAVAVDRWLADCEILAVAGIDLASEDRAAAIGYDELRIVDGRLLVGLDFKGDAPPEDEAVLGSALEMLDLYCRLTHCLYRAGEEYGDPAMVTAMSVARLAEIDARAEGLKRQLSRDAGVMVRVATLPLSPESIDTLIGGGPR